jgi:pSer/pThr/pTyr-binding forkhead associated (FHA) protein
MSSQVSTYIITREDLAVDPVTVVSDGLKIGRLPTCELVLNHPTVSRLHAGIKETGGHFYIYNFSHSSGTTLNGRLIPTEEADTLADGDVLQIGPFFLNVERQGEALHLRVSLQVAVHVGEAEAAIEAEQHAPAPSPAAPAEVANALSVFWTKRKREEGKMQRKSPLRPQAPARVLGKARFNWTPTRDLVRPWPFAIFTWGLIVIAVLSAVSAYAYDAAFSPAPVSDPHTRTQMTSNPAIATHANGDSCTTCHTIKASMESGCASCHQTEAFSSAVSKQHVDAGITCMSCHTDHRGKDFSPAAYSLQTCNECHNDNNKKLYNGKRVGTPHSGTFGYPVVNGKWVWRGLSDEEWAQKPAEIRQALGRWPTTDENQKRSAQFHIVHLHRVRVAEGLSGNEAGEVSCSTCHKSFAPTIDRATPLTTCASCHSGTASRDVRGNTTQIAAAGNTANCTSCHVQHVKSTRRWGTSLLAAGGQTGKEPPDAPPQGASPR